MIRKIFSIFQFIIQNTHSTRASEISVVLIYNRRKLNLYQVEKGSQSWVAEEVLCFNDDLFEPNLFLASVLLFEQIDILEIRRLNKTFINCNLVSFTFWLTRNLSWALNRRRKYYLVGTSSPDEWRSWISDGLPQLS